MMFFVSNSVKTFEGDTYCVVAIECCDLGCLFLGK